MCTHEKESIQLGFQVKKWRLHIIQFMRWEYFLLTSLWLQQLALIIWIVQTQNRCTRTKSIQIWKQTTNYKLNFFPFAFLCLLLFQQTFYNSYQPSIFSNTDNFEAIFVSGFRITNETTEWENSNSEFTLFFFQGCVQFFLVFMILILCLTFFCLFWILKVYPKVKVRLHDQQEDQFSPQDDHRKLLLANIHAGIISRFFKNEYKLRRRYSRRISKPCISKFNL